MATNNVRDIQSPEDFVGVLRSHGMDLPVEESMAELRKPIDVGEKNNSQQDLHPAAGGI